MPHAQAVEVIRQGSSAHFDPDIVDAFVAIAGELAAIAQRFADTHEDVLKKASRA